MSIFSDNSHIRFLASLLDFGADQVNFSITFPPATGLR